MVLFCVRNTFPTYNTPTVVKQQRAVMWLEINRFVNYTKTEKRKEKSGVHFLFYHEIRLFSAVMSVGSTELCVTLFYFALLNVIPWNLNTRATRLLLALTLKILITIIFILTLGELNSPVVMWLQWQEFHAKLQQIRSPLSNDNKSSNNTNTDKRIRQGNGALWDRTSKLMRFLSTFGQLKSNSTHY